MSGERLAILAVGVALAGVILTSNRGLRQDMAQLRRDMREDIGKLESRLDERIDRLAHAAPISNCVHGILK